MLECLGLGSSGLEDSKLDARASYLEPRKTSSLEAGTLSLEEFEGYELELRSWKLKTRTSGLDAGGEGIQPRTWKLVEIGGSTPDAASRVLEPKLKA